MKTLLRRHLLWRLIRVCTVCPSLKGHQAYRSLYRGFKDTGYLSVYFKEYGILSFLLPGIWDTVFNISVYFQGYGIFMKIKYGDICRDMGYLPFNFKG